MASPAVDYARENKQRFLAELKNLLRIPSISTLTEHKADVQRAADFVATEGAEHELMESWLVQEVEKGAKLPGLYPPNEENKKRYEAWKKSR